MKSIVISLLLLNLSISLFSQSLKTQVAKPVIDTSIFGRWPSAEMPSISGDGNYALYMIRNQPTGGATLVIRSLKNKWKREIVNALNASFTADCRKVFFICGRSLCSLDLDDDNIDSIAKTSSYRLVKQNGVELLIYQLNNTTKELKIVNLKSNLQKSFTGVINYLFSYDGNVLVLLKQSNVGINDLTQTIDWINFPAGDSRNIWNGASAANFVFDAVGNRLAFVVETKNDKGGKTERSVFYYKRGSEKAELLADSRTKGIDSNLVINGIANGFSKDGETLFINLKEKDHHKPKPGAVMVDVWSYQDVKLQSLQLAELSESQMYKAAVCIKDHHVVRLQQEGDRSISIVKQWSSKVEATQYKGDLGEVRWNAASQNLHYLVSTDNGERQELPLESESISLSGKYIIGKVAGDKDNFYCYNTSTDKIQNITRSISAPFDKKYGDESLSGGSKCLEMGSWLENERKVIFFDRYDMWLVDPDGIQLPVNLTNGYGQKNKIIFRFPEIYRNKFISANGMIIVRAFNRINKNEGFYVIQMRKQSDPKLLTTGPYSYEIPDNPFNSAHLDSLGSKRFLVRRESATQSPNYFLTSDFKSFTAVTDVYPESSYIWLTTELYTWKSLNGESLQGILYKPDNFDPKKKYPVIFHYYERMSDQLNKYREPKAITAHLNIPLFVSNGYLVFTPDIHYEIGKTGESALNAVVSAAHFISKFPWVDARRMGIQGHSFGGYETNFIVTHSNLFAAAMSSAGFSDFVSSYNSLGWGGRSAQSYFEEGQQGRMGLTLWERPDFYIKQTTIFHAYYVNTPLLMMANKQDEFNFRQQLELFLSLRRLGKRAWLLQYDNEDHILSRTEDALQHTIRMTQFFNHYLKDSAAASWMLYGIPAKEKGKNDGLELIRKRNKSGKWITPGEGLLISTEKKKLDALQKRKTVTTIAN